MAWTFLVWAPPYTHRSAGVRALYRLCHHLNRAGYRSAVVAEGGTPPKEWAVPLHRGPVRDSIVIYPEIVSGNPLGAGRVVRWALNDPGLLGGDTRYADDEMVFAYDPQRLAAVGRAAGRPLGPERVLWVALVDPRHIHPDPRVPRTIDCSFVSKGKALADRFPLPVEGTVALESLTPTMAALGDTLRRTRTLYSYDHYSNLLREAAISGCAVRTVDEQGRWHDPRGCDCARNIVWQEDLQATYAARFHDRRFVDGFVRELRTRWAVAPPSTGWRLRRALRATPGARTA